jgi:hypothetical protein
VIGPRMGQLDRKVSPVKLHYWRDDAHKDRKGHFAQSSLHRVCAFAAT